jgi:hypothetical protein
MVVQQSRSGEHEETSLLRGERDDGGSSETTTASHRGDEEVLEDADRANQQVGTGRAVLICLSVFGLIFLQGMRFVNYSV